MARYISLPENKIRIPGEKYEVAEISDHDGIIIGKDWLVIHVIGTNRHYLLKPKTNEKTNPRPVSHRSLASPVPVPEKKTKPGQAAFDFRENNESPV